MAFTDVVANISSTGPTTYTVPANTFFVGSANFVSGTAVTVIIDGVTVGTLGGGSATGIGAVKPISAGAGRVFSASGGAYGLTGQLFAN